jgi:hypothetical protein
MRKFTPGLTLAASLFLAACSGGGGGGLGSSSGGGSNQRPTANAGVAQSVNSGVVVTLNGSGTDSDGTIASFAWTQTAGAAVTLSSSTAAQPTFTAPTVATATVFTFSLVVTDNRGLVSNNAATVNITVNPLSGNLPPVANGGTAQTVTSGAAVTLNGSASNDPDGTIATYAWTQTAGTNVTLSSTSVAQPTFTAPTVATATTLTFSLIVTDNLGLASTASTVNITVNPLVAGDVNVTGRVRYARPLFAIAPPRGLNYAAPVLMPSRGVIVRAMSGATVLASTTTDDSGDYSLTVASNTTITIQVIARILRDNTVPLPRWDVRVQDGVGGTPFTHSSAAFNSGAGTTQNIDIPTNINAAGQATGTRASGPFAALDTIYEGIQLVLTASPSANFPALIVDWGSQADGTFFDGSNPQRIALLSDLTEDTDEYDQHVVAHEFGHYIEFNFSRADNIGGAHGLGDRLDIRVAFGEGFGYAFAAMVLQDPDARDSFVNGGILASGGFNIETNPRTTPPGANGDEIGCWCSESSVWAILYDIYDTAADSGDTLALGFGPIWTVLTGPQRTTPAFTSIFSFIAALKAAQPGSLTGINTLTFAQNIDNIADAFGTGETHLASGINAQSQLPLYTTITVGTPVQVVSSDDAGNYNMLGNHRFLRYTAASSGTRTVTVTTTNANADADVDFRVWRAGSIELNAEDFPPPVAETGQFTAISGTTYVIDVYDCANGCSGQGTPGDYTLTVTIN